MSDQSNQNVGTNDAAQAAPIDHRCQACGRQDETLRIVAYPYVFSLVVVTFRRAFTGLWCWRHRLRHQALAGMISAVLGWFGIPYGFVFTPVTLWKLARGGELPAAPNQAMLKQLAEQKLRSGDKAGAIRCLEAALSLGEDQEAQDRLSSRTSYDGSLFVASPSRTALRFTATLGIALLLGAAVGVIDYLFVSLYSSWMAAEVPFYIAILTWVPLVALAALTSLSLFQLLEWALGGSRVVSMPLALGLSVFASALAAYGIPLGRSAADLAAFARSGSTSLTPLQWLLVTGQTLTQGGVLTLRELVQIPELWSKIYLGVLGAAALYLVLGSLGVARRTVRWQQRVRGAIQLVTNWRPMSSLAGWAAMGGVALLGAMFTVLFSLPPALLTSSPEAFEHNQSGTRLLDEGDLEGAIEELEQAVGLEPDSAEFQTNLGVAYLTAGRLPEADGALSEGIRLEPVNPLAHFGRGVVHFLTGDLLIAEQELTTALDQIPAFPAAHYTLASLRGRLGDSDAAVLHLEEAIRLDPGFTDAQIELALTYLGRGEFEMAISQVQDYLAIDPDSAEAHAVLSMAYRRLGQFDRAEQSLETAEILAVQSEANQLLAAAFADINDFDQAEVYLLQAGTGLGWAGHQSLALARLYTAQGRLGEALEAIEQALTLGADPVAILEGRADVYIEMADLAGGQDQLLQAGQIVPERGSVHAGLARVHLYHGEAQEAEREARRALELGPYAAGPHAVLALALHAQGDVDEALIEAQEAVRLDPMRDLAHYALGLCYRSLGDEDQARAEFGRFLELFWDRAFVRDYRAEVEEYLLQE